MANEVKKIKRLTRKLEEEGNISVNEAVYLYILRCAYYHTLSFDIDAYSEIYGDIGAAFLQWFLAANDLFEKGIKGNYLYVMKAGTCPSEELLYEEHPSEYCEELEKWFDYTEGMPRMQDEFWNRYESVSQSIISAMANEYSDKVVSPDNFITRRAQTYIDNLTEKLKNEGDVTLDEADNLYLLLKYWQYVFRDTDVFLSLPMYKENFSLHPCHNSVTTYDIRCVVPQNCFSSLCNWYDEVYKALCQGKKGNFAYTVPDQYGDYFSYYAALFGERTKRIRDIICYANFPALEFNDRAERIPNIPFGLRTDSSRYSRLLYDRYGATQRIITDPAFFQVPDQGNFYKVWRAFKTGEEHLYDYRDLEFNEKPSPGLVKFHYLYTKSVFSFYSRYTSLQTRKELKHDGMVIFKQKDRDLVNFVLNIPNDVVYELSPIYDPCHREEIFDESAKKLGIFVKENFDQKNMTDIDR